MSQGRFPTQEWGSCQLIVYKVTALSSLRFKHAAQEVRKQID